MSLEDLSKKIEKQLTEDEIIRRELAPHTNVREVEAEVYYKKHKHLFVEPKKYQVSQIFTSKISNRNHS